MPLVDLLKYGKCDDKQDHVIKSCDHNIILNFLSNHAKIIKRLNI